MTIIRAKTLNLLQTKKLTPEQYANSKQNIRESEISAPILKTAPRRVVLELTNVCNLRCIMCGRNDHFKATTFDLDYLKKIEPILNRTEEVTLFGWGEPTIHPQFVDILKYLDKYPVRKYFVTNGMRLDKIKDAIFDHHVDIMAISLDGANAKTNNSIRCGGDFDKIIASVKDIVAERKKRGYGPYMNFVMTGMQQNIAELPEMVALAHDVGIEEVKLVYLTVFTPELLGQSLWKRQGAVQDVFERAEALADELGVSLKLPYLQGNDVADLKSHKTCYVGWRDLFIGSDGYVRPCQSTAMKLFAYDKYADFWDMWNSEEFQDFRSRVNVEGKMPPECKNCYQSSHANWNKKASFIQVGMDYAPRWVK